MSNEWTVDNETDGVSLYTSGLSGMCRDDCEELAAALLEAGERDEQAQSEVDGDEYRDIAGDR